MLHPINSDQNHNYIQNSGLELRLNLLNIFTDYTYAYGLIIIFMPMDLQYAYTAACLPLA